MYFSLLIYITVVFFGVAVGSFLNCLIYRISVNEKPTGRSYCPKCKHQLSYKDLIPVFSYIFLLGKCRYCKKKISLEYLLVELLTGFLFSFSFLFFGLSIELIYFLFVLFFLILIFVYDSKHYIIPDFATFSLIGVSFIYLLYISFLEEKTSFLIYGIISAFFVFLFFFSLFYFTKGKGMGFGDVKFVIFMGLFLNFPNIVVGLFLSFFLGAIIGIGMIILKRKEMKSQIPFGPFLIIGTLFAYFYGERIIEFYLNYVF
jgi:prepilin signal peptidase PulO-like enzyme (type II secretory pathway)